MKHWLNLRIASDHVCLRSVQVACFAAAGLIPMLAFRKFAELELAEAGLLVGVLFAMTMALLYAALGVLLEFKARSAPNGS